VTTWSETGPRTAVFDAASGKRLRTAPEGISWPVYSARDEIIGSTYNRITRFDAEDFEPLGSIPGVPGGIFTLSVSPDGRTLSVYTLSDTLSMYDLTEGIRLGDPIQVSSVGNVVVDPYALPRTRTVSGMFSPDGTELAANILAGVALWDLRPSSQAEAACRMAGRDLTEDEWKAYLADLGPYHSTCGFGIE
jgi:WD40 repeat protein